LCNVNAPGRLFCKNG